jgi:hypothetical protein
LETTKTQTAEQDQKRADELADLKARFADVQSARTSFRELAKASSPLARVTPTVSLITMIGFFGIVIYLLSIADDIKNDQLINICIGALVAAFSTVINFWLGSSKGSQNKDLTTIQLQSAQTAQTTEIIKAQSAQTAEALKSAAKAAAPAGPVAPAPGAPKPPTADNFNACVDNVLLHEGGYTNDPQGPGGPTNFGITIADWRE